MHGMPDRSHLGFGLIAGHAPHAQQTGLALDQGDEANPTLADGGVAFPVADPLARFDDGGTLGDAPTAETGMNRLVMVAHGIPSQPLCVLVVRAVHTLFANGFDGFD